MKVIEMLKLGQKWLEMLQNACISMKDCRFIGLYEEYERMVLAGEKITYIVAILSEKHNISIRQVYYIIRKFSSDCNFNAVV